MAVAAWWQTLPSDAHDLIRFLPFGEATNSWCADLATATRSPISAWTGMLTVERGSGRHVVRSGQSKR